MYIYYFAIYFNIYLYIFTTCVSKNTEKIDTYEQRGHQDVNNIKGRKTPFTNLKKINLIVRHILYSFPPCNMNVTLLLCTLFIFHDCLLVINIFYSYFPCF